MTHQQKMEVLDRSVGECPKITLSIEGKDCATLLDGGSQVSLIRREFFERELEPLINSLDDARQNAHQLFNLRMADKTPLNIGKYIEANCTFLGLNIPDVAFMVVEDHFLPVRDNATFMPVTAGQNLLKLAHRHFVDKYGEECLQSFTKPRDCEPSLFAQMLSHHWKQSIDVQTSALITGFPGMSQGQSQSKKKLQHSKLGNDSEIIGGRLGIVVVGNQHHPMVIPPRSYRIIKGRVRKRHPLLKSGKECLVEVAEKSNLPAGLQVNTCVATFKQQQIAVIIQNGGDVPIWIREPHFAAELYDSKIQDWETEISLVPQTSDSGEFSVTVQAVKVLPEDVENQLIKEFEESHCEEPSKSQSQGSDPPPKPEWGTEPVYDESFDFETEVKRLPFPCNIGSVKLTGEQQKRFIKLLYANKNVFSLHDGDLGVCDRLYHTIPVMDDKPVYLAHRTIPPQLKEEVRECIKTWLEQGVIQPSTSPYASQVVLVRKKTGELRICVDYRKLNNITVRDAFPLPRIDEILQAITNCACFATFDLAQGYLQMLMDPKDRHKTAFRVGSGGLFEFLRMPFGLSNAPASFCRLMEMCLGDQQYVTLLLYLDDICIFAKDPDELIDRIELVFQRLQSFNLKIKPKKSHFFKEDVIFLGHTLSSKGILPNPEKIEKIMDWCQPTTHKELHSFVGLCSYYRRFIPNFSQIAKPLHELIGPMKPKEGQKKYGYTTEFHWTQEHQESFDKLKHALTTAPVLIYPDFSKPFVVEIDASGKGLGAVLSQTGDDGKLHPVAFASRSLHPNEQNMKNYSSAKLELLGLKWAVTEKFRDYLLGSKFTVYTDNNPVAYVKKGSNRLGASQIRWLADLASFDFDIKYRTGKSNTAADALSRRSHPKLDKTDMNDDEDEAIVYAVQVNQILTEVIGGSKLPIDLRNHAKRWVNDDTDDVVTATTHAVSVLASISPEMMHEAQEKDEILSCVIHWLKTGKKPRQVDIQKSTDPKLRKCYHQFQRFSLINGVLHRKVILEGEELDQLCVPQIYRTQVLQLLHDNMGHQGIERTLLLVMERFWWPFMTKEITTYVQQCQRCNTARGPYVTPKTKLGSLIANGPMDLVCMDYITLDPSRNGTENVLVITDAFSKFSVAIPTKNQQALTTAKVLVDKWFHPYGIPNRIHSDRGKSFDNEIIHHLCKLYGIDQSMTTAYNPRGNSPAERFNRTLISLVQTLSKEQKLDWPSHLPALTFAYNATPHATTKLQPFQLMFGRKAPTPCDRWLCLDEYKEAGNVPKSVWLREHQEQLGAAKEQVLSNIKKSTSQNAARHQGHSLPLEVGDLVLVCDHGEGRRKIADRYKSIIYQVAKHHSDPNVYYIREYGTTGMGKPMNRRQLHPYPSPHHLASPDQVLTYQPMVKLHPQKPTHGYNLRQRRR